MPDQEQEVAVMVWFTEREFSILQMLAKDYGTSIAKLCRLRSIAVPVVARKDLYESPTSFSCKL